MDAKKIVPVLLIAGGAAVLARKFGSRMCSSMSEMIQRMPDDAPPKWMFNNITALRDEHVRILEQNERILDGLGELGREHGELLGARESGSTSRSESG